MSTDLSTLKYLIALSSSFQESTIFFLYEVNILAEAGGRLKKPSEKTFKRGCVLIQQSISTQTKAVLRGETKAGP